MGIFLFWSKSTTSTALGISEISLLAFGVLLVVGEIAEYREKWKKHLKAFEMFVILSVAGELIADGGIFLFSSRLQTISEGEIGVLHQRASQQELRAASLEARLADRHVTLEQRKKMLDLLRTSAGTSVAVTFLTPAAPDAQEFSVEIGEIFRDAQWRLVPHPWPASMDTPVHGFALDVRKYTSASDREFAVAQQARGILDDRISVVHSKLDPTLKVNLVVFVGSK